VNRRDISGDISGKFNAAIDFFELVVTAHVLAAAMHYFGLSSKEGSPTRNIISLSDGSSEWLSLKHAGERIVDNYVMVSELTTNPDSHQVPVSNRDENPHAARVACEHSYVLTEPLDEAVGQKRQLPRWLTETPGVSLSVKQQAPDGVFNYASAVLNDGLLLLELRDAIREGDGPRVIRCWKFMLLHWRHAKHTKYSLEVLHLIAGIHSTASERIAHELTWCRFINPRRIPGGNIPIDLFMEHLNRTLKDYLMGLGPNVSETSIVQTSRSLQNLMEISAHFDEICTIHQDSIYHTSKCYGRDLDLILEELTSRSRVFDYVPGRFHRSFRSIKPHISQNIDVDKLFSWINKHKAKISNRVKLRYILHEKM
jgi:hypothetical protein